MLEFVYAGGTLPADKADIDPLDVPAINGFSAADYNNLKQACDNLKAAFTNGAWHGFQSQGADPLGTSAQIGLWVRTSDKKLMIHTAPSVSAPIAPVFVDGEAPAVSGGGTTLTLAATPSPIASLVLMRGKSNGAMAIERGFTILANVITLTIPQADVNDEFIAYYRT